MPTRTIPLLTGEFYHVFNRGITDISMFVGDTNNNRAIEIMNFYRLDHTIQRKVPDTTSKNLANPVLNTSFSHYRKLDAPIKEAFMEKLLDQSRPIVEIIAFTLMPNHFHFLLRQLKPGGISQFIGNFKSSYTQYYNTRNHRRGPIFEGRFKVSDIRNDEQLLYVSRYIHLNPYTSKLVTTYTKLLNYPWTSLRLYRKKSEQTSLARNHLLDHFTSAAEYVIFVLEKAEYYKTRREMKILLNK